MNMNYAFDYIQDDDVEIHVDDRGVAHVDAIVLREGPMRYYRPGIGERWELIDVESLESALKTIGGAPVTDDHPPDFLDPETLADHARGLGEMTAEIVTLDDGRRALKQHLMIVDPLLTEAIRQGKSQISTGREFAVVDEPGEWNGLDYDIIQRDLRINHIAIVDSGRCGESCSIDGSSAADELPEAVRQCEKAALRENPEMEKGQAVAVCRSQDAEAARNRAAGLSLDTDSDAVSIISDEIKKSNTGGNRMQFDIGNTAFDVDVDCDDCEAVIQRVVDSATEQIEQARDEGISEDELNLNNLMTFLSDVLDVPVDAVASALSELSDEIDDPMADEDEEKEEAEMDEDAEDQENETEGETAMDSELIDSVATLKALDSEFSYDGESRRELIESALDSLDVEFNEERSDDYLQAILDTALDSAAEDAQKERKTVTPEREESAEDAKSDPASKWYNIGGEK